MVPSSSKVPNHNSIMDRIVGRLVSLILFAFFVSKLIDSVRKLNDDKIGMAISVKRYTSKKIDAVFIGYLIFSALILYCTPLSQYVWRKSWR